MASHPPFLPDWTVSPGVVLTEALAERGWSQSEFARRTDRPLKTINEIVRGKTAITPDTAIQFERAMGIPARVWLNLERIHAEAEARTAARKEMSASLEWLRHFPIRDLQEHNKLPRTHDKVRLLEALLTFLGTSSPEAWERQWGTVEVAFRRSQAYQPAPEALSAWLRWGELEAPRVGAPFDAALLRASLPRLRALTMLDPIAFEEPLLETLSGAGVALLLIPELEGTHSSGAAWWLDRSRAAIQLSLRHKTNDEFWFALLHECGHLLEGLRRRTYVDLVGKASDDPDEARADAFARDALIDRDAYREFAYGGRFAPADVRRFAQAQGIATGIVVGRLRHDGLIAPRALAFLRSAVDWK